MYVYAIYFISFILMFLLVSVFLGFVATTQLANPVAKLQKGAEIISTGNYSHRINIQTNDEIEQLAAQFNLMAKALGEREQQIEKHQHTLEDRVVARTNEFRKEKEKLQAILDNVPSTFLLLDENCQIISDSTAIGRFANVNPKQVLGKKCTKIFANYKFCKKCSMRKSGTHKFVETNIEEERNELGETIYIEHISIPIILNKNRQAFLEILTDVTTRKKIEENLLKTEKLAATGEMSAVIAHEMRNSLTSVKMIMQLQLKSSKNPEEQEALEVAVNSIYHMEKIVDNLLRFSRLVPFEYQYIPVNPIVEDSILFIQPQLRQQKVKITQNLDSNLPETYLDNNQIKEALVNVLLNAVQAEGKNREIQIESKLIQLDRDLIDYDYSYSASSETVGSQNRMSFLWILQCRN